MFLDLKLKKQTNNRKLSITPDKNSVVQKHEGKF